MNVLISNVWISAAKLYPEAGPTVCGIESERYEGVKLVFILVYDCFFFFFEITIIVGHPELEKKSVGFFEYILASMLKVYLDVF